MGSRTWLASREDVALALGIGTTVRDIRALDRVIASATDTINRDSGYSEFAPREGTTYLPWPEDDTSSAFPYHRLYLGREIHASISAVAVGPSSTAIAAGAGGWTAYPRNRNADDEPIRYLELDRSGSASWATGATRPQDQVAVTGVAGWSDTQRSVGALSGSLNSSATTLDLATATQRVASAGVGNQIKIDNERMIVVDREPIDTGENLGAALDAYESATILSQITVADGTDYAPGEVLTIDEEDMLIERVRGNVLGVRRGWGGTTLADHAMNADIWAWRRLVVERGAAGTTAATHSAAAAVTRWVEPPALHSYAIALAINESLQVGASYSRTSGTRDSEAELKSTGVALARKAALPYFRRGRVYAV